MKLSVIIPFHCELSTIGRAVDSVLANSGSLHSTEILVCNDGSHTENEVRSNLSAAGNEVVRLLRNVYAKGPGGARNTGLDAATGDVIAFLDADDFWLPGKLDGQLNKLREGANFITTGYCFDSELVTVRPPKHISQPIDIFLKRGIGTSTVLVTRQLVQNLRFKNIRFAQDIDFWYTLASSEEFRYGSIQDVFVKYSTGGATRNKWVQLKFLHKVLMLNRIGVFDYFLIMMSYIFSGVIKHYGNYLLVGRRPRS